MRPPRALTAALFGLATIALFGLAATAANAEIHGVVFVDRDGDGVRGPDEPGVGGVRVSNGSEGVSSDNDGGYSLPNPSRGFVTLTRPDGYDTRRWYRREGGDFALTPVAAPRDFFFVQISDAHVFREAADFQRYSMPPIPPWLPRWLRGRLMLWKLGELYEHYETRAEIVAALAAAGPLVPEGQGRSGAEIANAYLDEFARPGSELGRVAERARAAFDEVAGLRPHFVLSTGDHVLEGNAAPTGVVLRWLGFYRELAEATGVPFYHTFGNNEIAAFERDDANPADPAYGRGAYERTLGPTTYSFDRGAFHFAVTDTHIPRARDPEPPWWEFDAMEPAIRDWLEADLAAHPDRTLVVLNHEPFFSMPAWDPYEPADDDGVFARQGVDYVIAGHVHRNGLARIGDTTHIVTGALSGGRWMLPEQLHARGYRLFYAKGDRLYSAWKPLGGSALGFVDPPGEGSGRDGEGLAPASRDPKDAGALAARTRIVAVAADVSGPYAEVELLQDGVPIAFERWGDYFVSAVVSPPIGNDESLLTLRARSAAGKIARVQLPLHFERAGAAARRAEGGQP